MKLPARAGSGTGIWQLITDALVCASAGLIETIAEALAAPSISARRLDLGSFGASGGSSLMTHCPAPDALSQS